MSHIPYSIDSVRKRIREDLKAAMSAKRTHETAVLRTLLAALDNAEAVSVPPERYTVRAFGDPKTEVPRKQLAPEDVDAIVRCEEQERLSAAAALENAGRTADAARLREEVVIVTRYLMSPDT